MPIWSLTAERLEKLKDAIRKKKAEYDELDAKSDKDLWCEDLAAFEAEWEKHLALNAEIQTNIRRMGRRVSKKIGAGGGGGRGRKAKGDDDEYEPEKKGRKKAAPKVETKTAQRFAEMFSAKPKVKKEEQPEAVELSDNFSDDDFAALSRSKPAVAKPAAAKPAAVKPAASKPAAAKPLQSRSVSESRSISQARSISQSEEPEVVPVPVRNKRAAASKARTLFDASSDSDEDDDKMLGDVGALVKGIGSKPPGESSARVSLHAMSRPDSSHGNTSSGALSKPKIKSAKAFEFDTDDETNYELLAKPSPLKATSQGSGEDDDEDELTAAKSKPAVKAAVSAETKKRGRPAGANSKAEGKAVSKHKVTLKAATTTSTLSPAAKRYAAKKKALNDSDDDMEEAFADESIAPRPVARARPGRAAAANRKVIIDDEDSSMSVDEQDEEEEEEEEEESDDPFQIDDDDD